MVSSTSVANNVRRTTIRPSSPTLAGNSMGSAPRHARQLPYLLGPCWIYPAQGLLVQR